MNLVKYKIFKLFLILKKLLNLKEDFDEQGTFATINEGVEFKSGNAWGLIFAIFIASIGLNVNSTAVIIGAMLISPLMGPIVGTGYSLGTHNFSLFKKSVTNLIYAVVISITTSALFFLLSPNGAEQSELLARTQPTFFDVLIAFFGGAAGIIASTRKNKGNAIPGVAIATALMPPLCTVGYGIANLKFSFMIGAFYLFAINTTFILISTYLFVRLLDFKLVSNLSVQRNKLIHKYMTWTSIVIVIPSLYMAWYLHKKTQFENNAKIFLSHEFNFKNTLIASKEINFKISNSEIKVRLFGEELSNEHQQILRSKIANNPYLSDTKLQIDFIGRDSFSINDLEQKFVTKTDLSQFIKIEKNKEINNEQELSAEITQKLNSELKNNYVKVLIRNYSVEFIWKKRPTKDVLKKAEFIAYQVLTGITPEFSHSTLIE